jgi:hypothetical protein
MRLPTPKLKALMKGDRAFCGKVMSLRLQVSPYSFRLIAVKSDRLFAALEKYMKLIPFPSSEVNTLSIDYAVSYSD